VLGPNGTSKTTTIKLLATLLLLSSGTAIIGGFMFQCMERAMRQIGSLEIA
jgi:ABC-type multidrug transport system ATPase subunit